MNNFLTVLEALMVKNNMTGAQLAKLSSISPPTISRIRAGEKSLDHDELTRIISSVSLHTEDRARLLAAHLEDERVGPARDNVRIEIIGGSGLHEAPPKPDILLAPQLEHALAVIREHMTDPDLRDIILGLSGLFEDGAASEQRGAQPRQRRGRSPLPKRSPLDDAVRQPDEPNLTRAQVRRGGPSQK